MATYIYRCDCMNEEVEVDQSMSEEAFTSCLEVHERLGETAPEACARAGGHPARRLIAGAGGVIVKGARTSCSVADRPPSCQSCCADAAGGKAGACPFG